MCFLSVSSAQGGGEESNKASSCAVVEDRKGEGCHIGGVARHSSGVGSGDQVKITSNRNDPEGYRRRQRRRQKRHQHQCRETVVPREVPE